MKPPRVISAGPPNTAYKLEPRKTESFQHTSTGHSQVVGCLREKRAISITRSSSSGAEI